MCLIFLKLRGAFRSPKFPKGVPIFSIFIFLVKLGNFISLFKSAGYVATYKGFGKSRALAEQTGETCKGPSGGPIKCSKEFRVV